MQHNEWGAEKKGRSFLENNIAHIQDLIINLREAMFQTKL